MVYVTSTCVYSDPVIWKQDKLLHIATTTNIADNVNFVMASANCIVPLETEASTGTTTASSSILTAAGFTYGELFSGSLLFILTCLAFYSFFWFSVSRKKFKSYT